jgi:hypothetical protein
MAGVVDPAPPDRNLCLDLLGTLERRKQYARRVSAPRTGDKMMDNRLSRAADYSTIFLRFALGVSFLSAVADRFGLWGTYGQPHVAWGDFARFVAYTGKLNWFVPTILLPTSAWASTFAEMLLGLALVVDFSRELQHC